MMSDRNILLQQLGVQPWYAHYRLAARSSPRFACAPLVAPADAGRSERSAANPALGAKAILTAVAAPVAAAIAAPTQPAAIIPVLAKPTPERAELGVQATARVSAPLMPGFDLSCYSTPSLVLFSVESAYEQARQQVLLQNILKACALPDAPLTWHGQFCWPVFKGDKIEADQNALLPHLLQRWLQQVGAQDRSGCILFGVPGELRELLVGDRNNVILPYSLSALLREPAGKAQTWRELKAALPALRERVSGRQ